MYTIIIAVHVIVCITLTILVLMQHGKGADAGVAFGSGSSSSLFGSAGSDNFMVKVTTCVAIAFFATSLTLCLMKFDDSNQAIHQALTSTIPE